jgi:hypothetical protein
VTSRKEWRNRDAGLVDGVMALLDGLRAGLQADVVALVDDDRSEPDGAAPPSFWEPLGRGRCAETAWEGWYRALRADARADVACACGAGHRLQGFLIHDRWALLVVPGGPVRSDGVAAIASCVRALAERLPPGRGHERAALEEEGPPVEGEPLVWWVRRQPH